MDNRSSLKDSIKPGFMCRLSGIPERSRSRLIAAAPLIKIPAHVSLLSPYTCHAISQLRVSRSCLQINRRPSISRRVIANTTFPARSLCLCPLRNIMTIHLAIAQRLAASVGSQSKVGRFNTNKWTLSVFPCRESPYKHWEQAPGSTFGPLLFN